MSKKKKKQEKLPDGLVGVKPFKLPEYIVVFTKANFSGAHIHESSIQAMNDFLIPIAHARLKIAHSRPDYYLDPDDIGTSGHIMAEGFVVHSGSRFLGDDETTPARIRDIRAALKSCGALAPCEGGFDLKTDLTFDSPATAASVLLGREASASVWKDHKGRTIEENQAAASKPSSEVT